MKTRPEEFDLKILFLHGWQSVVGGVKPSYLQRMGHDVSNPPLDDNDFPRAVAQAQQALDRHRPDVIVGSSRGGAIAMNIDSGSIPLVLLCPAWKNWGSCRSLKPNAVVLHSRDDEVIPFSDSAELVAVSGLPTETLIEVGGDHRLADEASLSVMDWACRVLATGQRFPWQEPGEESGPSTAGAGGLQMPSASAQEEASYICDACGEEIVVPVDLSEGSSQVYVEDCPVCCRANMIHVDVDAHGEVLIWAEPEQDND